MDKFGQQAPSESGFVSRSGMSQSIERSFYDMNCLSNFGMMTMTRMGTTMAIGENKLPKTAHLTIADFKTAKLLGLTQKEAKEAKQLGLSLEEAAKCKNAQMLLEDYKRYKMAGKNPLAIKNQHLPIICIQQRREIKVVS